MLGGTYQSRGETAMKWTELRPILDRRLTIPRITLPAGKVLAGDPPADLYEVVDALVETKDDTDDLEAHGPSSVLGEAGLLQPWLEFQWDGLGPTSSWALISLINPGGSRSFACWRTEDATEVVIAALEPLSPTIASTFLRDLLAGNGESYSVWLFGGVPSRTVNHRPDLTSGLTVKECYHEWMERGSERDPSLWAELRDRLIGESEEPDHLRRSQRALEQLKGLSEPGATRRHLDDRNRAGRDVSDAERRLILDNYFAVTYREQLLPTPSIESLGQALRLLASGDGDSAWAGTEYLCQHAEGRAGPQTAFQDRLTIVLNQAWRELPRPREKFVEGLANAARADQSLLVVEIAAAALALEGEDGATELLALLGSQDFAIRTKAAFALELLGRSARWAVPALVRALSKEGHDYVAHVVVRALERIGGEEANRALRRFLGGRDG